MRMIKSDEKISTLTTDDLSHGLRGGYLPPNVRKKDHLTGAQTGEMVIITYDGFEDIHNWDMAGAM